MSTLSKVADLLNVHPGEGRQISSLSGLYFILVMAFIFLQATTFGLFIAEFGSKSLPYAYLSIAVLASLVAFLYLRISERIPFNRLLYLNLGFLALMCTVFRLGLATPLRRSFIFLLPFWFQTLINLVNLVVWPLAGRLFDLRQAKRLFTLVLSGSWLSNVLGGFIIAPLVGRLGADNLLVISIVLIIASFFLLRAILRAFPDQSKPEQSRSRTAVPSPPKPTASPLKHPYIRLIFAYFILFWLCFYFVDNIFYDQAGAYFPDAAQLAGFIGQLIAVTGILGLISSTLLTSRIIGRYGLQVGLLIMPIVVITDIAAVALFGTLLPNSPILFWLVSSAKLLILALGFSLSQSASTLLYQPLPGDQRGRTQTMAEGIVQPFAIGLAGLSLLLFNTILGMGAVQLSYVFLFLGAVWIIVILLLGRQYPKTISQALAKREWGQSTTQLFDPTCRGLFLENMRSPRGGVVIYSMDMLEQSDPSSWEKTFARNLHSLLAHPSPDVRKDALRRVEKLGLSTVVGEVERHLGVETNSEVKAVALRVLASIGEIGSHESLVSFIDDPDPGIQRGALVGLLKYGGIDGVLAAGQAFNDLFLSPDPARRIRASNVLAEVGTPHFYQPALVLIRDRDPEVQNAALKAAAKIRNPHLWRAVVEVSGATETDSAAELALAAGGEEALSEIETVIESLSSDAETPLVGRARRQLISLIRTCGRIPGQRTVNLLLAQIDVSDNQVRTQVLESLSACGFHVFETDAMIADHVRYEIELAAFLTAFTHDFATSGDVDLAGLFIDAMETSIQKARDRVFLLLSFQYDSMSILRAWDAFKSGTDSQKAYALEVIETQLPRELKSFFIPLLENIPSEERLVRWDSVGVRPQRQNKSAGLEAIITGLPGFMISPVGSIPEMFQFSPWTRACALLEIGAQSILGGKDIVHSSQNSPEPLLREAALLSLDRLHTADRQGGIRMLSTFEKVIILKTVSIFSPVPDEILADVANLMEEVHLSEKETIITKGDHGDRLYIVVSGKLGAFDGERLLNYLDDGDVFGEMALLDPAPRSASVTALEPTHLLFMEQQPFRQLLAYRPEIAAGIITVLTRRLRGRINELN